MIFKNDWYSISIMTRAFGFGGMPPADYIDEEGRPRDEIPEEVWADRTDNDLRDVLRDVGELKVLLPNGELIGATWYLLYGLRGWQTQHVDLVIGTVGSGREADGLALLTGC